MSENKNEEERPQAPRTWKDMIQYPIWRDQKWASLEGEKRIYVPRDVKATGARGITLWSMNDGPGATCWYTPRVEGFTYPPVASVVPQTALRYLSKRLRNLLERPRAEQEEGAFMDVIPGQSEDPDVALYERMAHAEACVSTIHPNLVDALEVGDSLRHINYHNPDGTGTASTRLHTTTLLLTTGNVRLSIRPSVWRGKDDTPCPFYDRRIIGLWDIPHGVRAYARGPGRDGTAWGPLEPDVSPTDYFKSHRILVTEDMLGWLMTILQGWAHGTDSSDGYGLKMLTLTSHVYSALRYFWDTGKMPPESIRKYAMPLTHLTADGATPMHRIWVLLLDPEMTQALTKALITEWWRGIMRPDGEPFTVQNNLPGPLLDVSSPGRKIQTEWDGKGVPKGTTAGVYGHVEGMREGVDPLDICYVWLRILCGGDDVGDAKDIIVGDDARRGMIFDFDTIGRCDLWSDIQTMLTAARRALLSDMSGKKLRGSGEMVYPIYSEDEEEILRAVSSLLVNGADLFGFDQALYITTELDGLSRSYIGPLMTHGEKPQRIQNRWEYLSRYKFARLFFCEVPFDGKLVVYIDMLVWLVGEIRDHFPLHQWWVSWTADTTFNARLLAQREQSARDNEAYLKRRAAFLSKPTQK